MTRKEKRILASKLTKIYKIKNSQDVVDLHNAHLCLDKGKIKEAVGLAVPLSEKYPNNIDIWILLGSCALNLIDHHMAKVFFHRADEISPNNKIVYAGLGKAYFLNAEIIKSIEYLVKSIELGIVDKSVYTILYDILSKMGKFKTLIQVSEAYCDNTSDKQVYFNLIRLYSEEHDFLKMIDVIDLTLDRCRDLTSKERFDLELKRKLFNHEYDDVIKLFDNYADRDDDIIVDVSMALRNKADYKRAVKIITEHNFENKNKYVEAQGVLSNIYSDMGNKEKVHETFNKLFEQYPNESHSLRKNYATVLFREGNFEAANKYWADRNTGQTINLGLNKFDGNDIENIVVLPEQGIGDQIALMSTLVNLKSNIFLLVEERMKDLLKDNFLGINAITTEEFNKFNFMNDNTAFMNLGDLISEFPQKNSYLKVQKSRSFNFDKKTVGISWKSSNGLSGYIRSVEFETMMTKIYDKNTKYISLQYGDTRYEQEIAKKNGWDISFDLVDPLIRLDDYASLVYSLDYVVSVDNSLVHLCGAIGHNNTHVLIPYGSENMWYWGENFTLDPWYGILKLYRQFDERDWDKVLSEISINL